MKATLFTLNLAAIALIIILCIRLNVVKQLLQDSDAEKVWMSDVINSNIEAVLANEADTYSDDFYLRITKDCCLTCVNEGIALLENILGHDNVVKNLQIINASNYKITEYKTVYNSGYISSLDTSNTPYLYFKNEHGNIVFCVLLKPENYEYNKILISVIKQKYFGYCISSPVAEKK